MKKEFLSFVGRVLGELLKKILGEEVFLINTYELPKTVFRSEFWMPPSQLQLQSVFFRTIKSGA